MLSSPQVTAVTRNEVELQESDESESIGSLESDLDLESGNKEDEKTSLTSSATLSDLSVCLWFKIFYFRKTSSYVFSYATSDKDNNEMNLGISTPYFPITPTTGLFPTLAFKSPINTTFTFIPKSSTHSLNFIQNSSSSRLSLPGPYALTNA
ncbi:hypothetical protein SK128_012577 [Halocaridina rubra]|uniref:Uncharacterized protein n=1 Tax=Halocaridina rubra TaxID=373956 RepID=A0AAN8WKX6_HALRR